MKPLLLVTGANGFVGRALCKELLARGFQVRGATRKACRLAGEVDNAIVGEIGGATNWVDALRGVDIVIHLAARVHVMHDESKDPLAEFRTVNTQGTEHLALTAAACGVKRLIYASSIKVNGEETSDGHIYSELDIPAPQDPYGISKWEAELTLKRVSQQTGLEIVVVRPPLVYGEEVKGNFAQMMKVISNGTPLPLGSVQNQRDLVYVGNLVDALIVCALHPSAAGQTYLVSDGQSVSTPELLKHLADAMGMPICLFRCPIMLLRIAGKITGKSMQIARLLGSLQVNSDKICKQLNWHAPYTLQAGLERTVRIASSK